MDQQQFESILDQCRDILVREMRTQPMPACYKSSKPFEHRVREVLHDLCAPFGVDISLDDSGQTFPDIPAGRFGVEVKHTKADSWESIANSIRENQRVGSVEVVYLLFGKLGGVPDCRWDLYEHCVVHVRSTHDPRFQVDMTGTKQPLFERMGIAYDDFRELDIMDKMPYIRAYAREIHPDGRLWWLGSDSEPEHSTSAEVRIYTHLDGDEKDRLRAEALALCPQVFSGSRSKYDDAALFLITYHGILLSNARDLCSAGSAAGVSKADGSDVPYVFRTLERIADRLLDAFSYLDDALFDEYWGEHVEKADRLGWWLEKADAYAVTCAKNKGYLPSDFISAREAGA